jgi:putative PIG3 family NAD(P)H quinone oxidoreductase
VKAVVIREYGGPEVLEPRDVADPELGPDDVLVAIRATALNRGDLLQRMGLYPQPGPKPEHDVPGLEYAGEIVEVGSRVEGFQAGDRVMGIVAGGAYAERIVVHHRLAVRIPECLDWVNAAAVPEAFITAHDALSQCRMCSGESVLVHAAGSGVGIAAIQIASLLGATPVIGTAGSQEKLARAAELGMDVGICYRSDDFVDKTMTATGRRGADVIVDFVGAKYLERNVASLAIKGRMVVVGMLSGVAGELNLAALLAKRAEIRGTVLRPRPLEEKAAVTKGFEKSIVPHLASGRLRPVVDRVYSIDEVASAHEYMATNANFGKIVLTVGA